MFIDFRNNLATNNNNKVTANYFEIMYLNINNIISYIIV